jgi:hypothetical protein
MRNLIVFLVYIRFELIQSQAKPRQLFTNRVTPLSLEGGEDVTANFKVKVSTCLFTDVSFLGLVIILAFVIINIIMLVG